MQERLCKGARGIQVSAKRLFDDDAAAVRMISAKICTAQVCTERGPVSLIVGENRRDEHTNFSKDFGRQSKVEDTVSIWGALAYAQVLG
jgi:hypothetical protein